MNRDDPKVVLRSCEDHMVDVLVKFSSLQRRKHWQSHGIQLGHLKGL